MKYSPGNAAGASLRINIVNYKQDEVMLLTVKKQIGETLEVKTPAYYKTELLHKHYFLSDNHILVVSKSMVYCWKEDMGRSYHDEISYVLDNGQECTKEEFDVAFVEALGKMKAAAGLLEVNS